MNKENLIKLKNTQEELQKIEDKYSQELNKFIEKFKAEHNVEISKMTELREIIDYCKNVARENAESGYEKDGIKKRLGGIGIRVMKTIDYNEDNAIIWAKANMPVIVKETIDKKSFEKFANENQDKFNFVNFKDKIVVTFPKEIILDD